MQFDVIGCLGNQKQESAKMLFFKKSPHKIIENTILAIKPKDWYIDEDSRYRYHNKDIDVHYRLRVSFITKFITLEVSKNNFDDYDIESNPKHSSVKFKSERVASAFMNLYMENRLQEEREERRVKVAEQEEFIKMLQGKA